MPKVAAIAFKMMPDVVIHPKEAQEVAEIVNIANSWNIPVTPRGGGSWGFGGAVPSKGGVLLDMTSMDKIIGLDTERGVVRVQPGVVWLRLDEWLRRRLLHSVLPVVRPWRDDRRMDKHRWRGRRKLQIRSCKGQRAFSADCPAERTDS